LVWSLHKELLKPDATADQPELSPEDLDLLIEKRIALLHKHHTKPIVLSIPQSNENQSQAEEDDNESEEDKSIAAPSSSSSSSSCAVPLIPEDLHKSLLPTVDYGYPVHDPGDTWFFGIKTTTGVLPQPTEVVDDDEDADDSKQKLQEQKERLEKQFSDLMLDSMESSSSQSDQEQSQEPVRPTMYYDEEFYVMGLPPIGCIKEVCHRILLLFGSLGDFRLRFHSDSQSKQLNQKYLSTIIPDSFRTDEILLDLLDNCWKRRKKREKMNQSVMMMMI
jgi:hypothetical protein